MLVLTPNSDEVNRAASSRQTDECNADAVPRLVKRCILLEKGKSRNDTTNVAESDLPGAAHRSSVVATKIHSEPAYYNGHG